MSTHHDYVATLTAAAQLLEPDHRPLRTPDEAPSGAFSTAFGDRQEAVRWLDEHHHQVVTAIRSMRGPEAVDCVHALEPYYRLRPHRHQRLARPLHLHAVIQAHRDPYLTAGMLACAASIEQYEQPWVAMKLLERAHALLIQQERACAAADLLPRQAIALNRLGEVDQARAVAQDAIPICFDLGRDRSAGHAHVLLAIIGNSTGEHSVALSHASTATFLLSTPETADPLGLAEAETQWALAEAVTGEVDQALHRLDSVIEMLEDLGAQDLLPPVLLQRGIILTTIDPEAGQDAFRYAVSLREGHPDAASQAESLLGQPPTPSSTRPTLTTAPTTGG